MENRLMDIRRGEEKVKYIERVSWKPTLPHAK